MKRRGFRVKFACFAVCPRKKSPLALLKSGLVSMAWVSYINIAKIFSITTSTCKPSHHRLGKNGDSSAVLKSLAYLFALFFNFFFFLFVIIFGILSCLWVSKEIYKSEIDHQSSVTWNDLFVFLEITFISMTKVWRDGQNSSCSHLHALKSFFQSSDIFTESNHAIFWLSVASQFMLFLYNEWMV